MEPFVLYVSKRFLDRASKTLKLGFLVRKPLLEIFKKMDLEFKELKREEAKEALDKIAEAKGIPVTTGQLVKNLALAFFVPTGLFLAAVKKVFYRSGAEIGDNIMLEFLAEIPRAFRPSITCDVWLVVPKTAEAGGDAKRIIKAIVEKVGVPPMTEEEWESLKPIREKLAGKLEIKGISENLWTSL
jgi:isopentenyl diphosphate isomerase/L-lactate dehydrogenase-like FMN-dependent dehydrogenase